VFELLSKTKTKLLDVVVLSQKNRQPDDNPGAKLSVEMMMSNDILAFFDGNLRGFLFTKNPVAALSTGRSAGKQAELEGVPAISDTPNLTSIGAHVGALHWEDESTGFTFVVDLGLGGKLSNLELGDCKLSNWRLIPKEGGTVIVRFDIESNDVSEKAFGRLAKLKSREIEVLLLPPEITQDDLDPDPVLTPAQLRAANAKGQTIAEAKADAKAELTPEKAWPFPTGGPGSGPDAKSAPQDATDAVLADVKKNGAKPAAKKTAPAKKPAAASKRKPAAAEVH
jgi:hypothetical protein